MQRITRWLAGLLGLMVVTGLAVVFVFMLNRAPLPAPSAKPVSPIETPPPSPTATAESESTPLIMPTSTPTYSARATWTPWPTFTSRPTPTRRPGPTATPYPTRGPAPDAAGRILFMTSGPQPIKELPVDGQGRKIAEAKPLTLSLDFEPALLMASPNGRYLLLLQPALPPGIPYLYERQTQQLRPLLQTNSRWEDMFGWPHQWHPDSRHIVFWFSNNDELWLLDVEAGENTILAFTAGHIFVGSF